MTKPPASEPKMPASAPHAVHVADRRAAFLRGECGNDDGERCRSHERSGRSLERARGDQDARRRRERARDRDDAEGRDPHAKTRRSP